MMNIKRGIFSSGRRLLILLALLHFVAPSGAQAPGQLTGSATDWDEIYITAPADISNWALAPETTNNQSGTLNVRSTGNWKVEIKDANSDTSGQMTKYNIGAGTYDTGVKLASPMTISAAGGSEVTLSTTNQQILTGGPTPEGGQDVTINFNQPVSWDDQVLGSGYNYKLVVTFTGSLII